MKTAFLLLAGFAPVSAWAAIMTVPTSVSVPTLDEFALTGLAVAVGLLGGRMISKRKNK
ncbi:MAG: hypothetical protein IPG66_05105 [Hydrogenophilales bacterium]|nr:hypothetical protein [Hydrogenophilales bacterium]